MPKESWMQVTFKGKSVFVSKLAWDSGERLLPMKYQPTAGAKVYSAKRNNVVVSKGQPAKTVSLDVSNQSNNKSNSSSNNNKNKYNKYNKSKNNPTGRQQFGRGRMKFGKAGTRSEFQKKLVNEEFKSLLASFDDNDIVCFTDGACKGNPGPCGSGCVVTFGQTGLVAQDSLALGHGTNNISELYAIWLALKQILCNLDKIEFVPKDGSNGSNGSKTSSSNKSVLSRSIRILTDSKYSLGCLSLGWKIKANKELIDWIQHELDAFERAGFEVNIYWVGGHCGIQYNEMADSLATQAKAISMKQPKHLKKLLVDVTKRPQQPRDISYILKHLNTNTNNNNSNNSNNSSSSSSNNMNNNNNNCNNSSSNSSNSSNSNSFGSGSAWNTSDASYGSYGFNGIGGQYGEDSENEQNDEKDTIVNEPPRKRRRLNNPNVAHRTNLQPEENDASGVNGVNGMKSVSNRWGGAQKGKEKVKGKGEDSENDNDELDGLFAEENDDGQDGEENEDSDVLDGMFADPDDDSENDFVL